LVTFENVAQVREYSVTLGAQGPSGGQRPLTVSLDWEYGGTTERSLEVLEQAKVELMKLQLSPAGWLARRSQEIC
jgi:hypothetical protein